MTPDARTGAIPSIPKFMVDISDAYESAYTIMLEFEQDLDTETG